jgi:hypothetical protein
MVAVIFRPSWFYVDIYLIGALLYWCEGSKRERDRRVEFVNSDPRMISVFMKYLRAKHVDERRLKIRMTIHVQDDEDECRRYWKRIIGTNDSNFLTTIVKPHSISRKPLQYGTVTVRYNSVGLLRQINLDISELVKSVTKL